MDFTNDDFIQLREEDVVNTKQVVVVKNLPIILDENDLKRYFKQYGKMRGLKLLLHPNGLSKGVVYVKYEDADVARICAETLNNHILEGKLLKTTLMAAKNNHFLRTERFEESQISSVRISKEKSDEYKPKISEYQLEKLKKYNDQLKKNYKEIGITSDFFD